MSPNRHLSLMSWIIFTSGPMLINMLSKQAAFLRRAATKKLRGQIVKANFMEPRSFRFTMQIREMK
jgi:hypothetical protein